MLDITKRPSAWRFVKAFTYGIRESSDPGATSRYHDFELMEAYHRGRRAARPLTIAAVILTSVLSIALAILFMNGGAL